MDIQDSQRIKEIRNNTAKMADAFARIADALERLEARKTEPQYDAEEVAKDINRRVDMVKKEWNARHIEDEPQTCETCKHYDAEVESIACERCLEGKYSRYEPKDEPQTDVYEYHNGKWTKPQTERSK